MMGLSTVAHLAAAMTNEIHQRGMPLSLLRRSCIVVHAGGGSFRCRFFGGSCAAAAAGLFEALSTHAGLTSDGVDIGLGALAQEGFMQAGAKMTTGSKDVDVACCMSLVPLCVAVAAVVAAVVVIDDVVVAVVAAVVVIADVGVAVVADVLRKRSRGATTKLSTLVRIPLHTP